MVRSEWFAFTIEVMELLGLGGVLQLQDLETEILEIQFYKMITIKILKT